MPIYVLAEEGLLSTNTKQDSNTLKYYQDVSDSLMINARMLMRSYSLNYHHVNSGTDLEVEPTGQMNFGAGFNYKWLGLALNVGLPPSEQDKEKYGETQRQDLHIGIYGNRISGSINLQHYKGFYISNYIDTNTGNHIQIPSLETYNINFSALYFFNNKRFSYKAAYVRNAIQKQSAGSFAAGAYLTYDISESEVPVGGGEVPDSVGTQFNVLGVWSRTFGVSFGYTRTWVIKKKFFINATLVPGVGGKTITLKLTDKTANVDAGLAYRLDANISMGYEAKNWLMGLSATTSNQFYEVEGLVISPNSSSFKLFVAKRFGFGCKRKIRK